MRVAVLGDIGQPVYHVGDEAMTHAAVQELRARGIDEFLLFTRNVEDTLCRYADVQAAPTLQFPWPPNDRVDYLRRIRAVAAGDHTQLPQTDQVWAFIESLRSCDALLVAGGGNMNSIYGWLLYERAAAVHIARSMAKPVILSGQTLGPTLYGADRTTAAELLDEAKLLGGREASTVELAKSLNRTAVIAECLDDASFLDTCVDSMPTDSGDTVPLPAEYAAVTLAAPAGAPRGSAAYSRFVRSSADFLDHAQHITGLPLVFLPHMSSPGTGDGDEATHSDIVREMKGSSNHLVPIQSAYRTAQITVNSSLVLTSRYHPVVFAAGAATPVLAIANDFYSSTRVGGALALWGLEDFVLPLPSLSDGSASLAMEEVWSRREAISSSCMALKQQRRQEFANWWDAVAGALRGGPVEPVVLDGVSKLPATGEWAARVEATRASFLPLSAEVEELRAAGEHLAGELELARRDAAAARGELDAWFGSRSFRAVRKLASIRSVLRR